MMKFTKAEHIFYSTWNECEDHIKHWGYQPNTGYTSLKTRNDEIIYTRTINAVQKKLDDVVDAYMSKVRHGRQLNDKDVADLKALEMVQATINNERASQAKWKEFDKKLQEKYGF